MKTFHTSQRNFKTFVNLQRTPRAHTSPAFPSQFLSIYSGLSHSLSSSKRAHTWEFPDILIPLSLFFLVWSAAGLKMSLGVLFIKSHQCVFSIADGKKAYRTISQCHWIETLKKKNPPLWESLLSFRMPGIHPGIVINSFLSWLKFTILLAVLPIRNTLLPRFLSFFFQWKSER